MIKFYQEQIAGYEERGGYGSEKWIKKNQRSIDKILKRITKRESKKRVMGGTLTPGGPYLVGEAGPELIIPSSTGQIMNAQRTQQMQQASLQKGLGASGGSTINNMPVTNVSSNQSSTTVTATPMTHPSPIINIVNSAA